MSPSSITVTRSERAHVGMILTAAPSSGLPAGLFARVIAVRHVGRSDRLTLVPATLAEAFPELSVHADVALHQLSQAPAPDARTAGISPFDFSLGNDFLRCGAPLTGGYSFSAQASLSANAIVDLHFPLFHQPYGQLSVSLTGSAGLAFGLPASLHCDGSVPLPPLVGVVFGVPVYVQVSDVASVQTATAWNVGISGSLSLNGGITFKGRHVNPFFTAKAKPTVTSTGAGQISVGPQLELGIGAPEAPGFHLANVHLDLSPDDVFTAGSGGCSLDIQDNLAAGITFGPFQVDWPATIATTNVYNCPKTKTTPASVAVTNPGDQSSTVGTQVNLQIHGSDTDGGALSYSATSLPPGLSINPSTGLITGQPTTAGSSTVTVTATDASGPSGGAMFTWTIVASGTGNASFELLHDGSPFGYSQAFSADASTVAWPDGTEVVIHNTATGAEHAIDLSSPSRPGFVGIDALYLSPDGSNLTVLAVYDSDAFRGCRILFGSVNGSSLTSAFPAGDALPCDASLGPGPLGPASSDNKWLIAYDSSESQPGYYALNTLTGALTWLLPPDAGTPGKVFVSFPSTGSTGVALTETDSGSTSTTSGYLLHTDGSAPTPLPSLSAGYLYVAVDMLYPWSADGTRVAVPVSNGSQNGAALVDASTASVSVIPDADFGDDTSAFTADGSKFAYWACDRSVGTCNGYQEAVWEANSDGSGITRVSPNGTTYQPIAPIIDVGNSFATEADPTNPTIYTFSDSGTGMAPAIASSSSLTLAPGYLYSAGSRLVFAGWYSPDNSHGHASVWTSNPDGTGLMQLIPDDGTFAEVEAVGGISSTADRVTGLLGISNGGPPSSYEIFTAAAPS